MLLYTLYQGFLKNKKCSRTSLPASFSAWFLKKNKSLIIFYYLPSNFMKYWAICLLYLESNLDIYIIKFFFYMTKKSRQKNLISPVWKKVLRWTKKHFLTIFWRNFHEANKLFFWKLRVQILIYLFTKIQIRSLVS